MAGVFGLLCWLRWWMRVARIVATKQLQQINVLFFRCSTLRLVPFLRLCEAKGGQQFALFNVARGWHKGGRTTHSLRCVALPSCAGETAVPLRAVVLLEQRTRRDTTGASHAHDTISNTINQHCCENRNRKFTPFGFRFFCREVSVGSGLFFYRNDRNQLLIPGK